MNLHSPILLGILLSSFVTGLVIFFLKEESHRLRTWLNLLGAGTKLILVVVLLSGVYHGGTYTFAIEFLPGIPFARCNQFGSLARSLCATPRRRICLSMAWAWRYQAGCDGLACCMGSPSM